MAIYSVIHKTRFKYAKPVAASVNMAKLRPRDLPGQRLLSFELAALPNNTAYQESIDMFGNAGAFFQVEGFHDHFELEARSRIDVTWSQLDHPPVTTPWEEAVETLRLANRPECQDALQFTLESPMVRFFPDLKDYARPSFSGGKPIGEGAMHLMQRIHRDFKFAPGSTTLKTTLEMVFQTRTGVCQDFSHLMLGCLRSLGIPARYVSGYLETLPPPGKPKMVGVDASHAWVSVFAPGVGWLDFDPTNNLMPGPRHITLAWGRDFSDVSPLRGVIYGGGDQKLSVSVDVSKESIP